MSNTLTLNNPMSETDWDKLLDVELEKTDHIFFATPSGRKVSFAKVDAIMQKIDEKLGRQRTNNRYNEGYTDGILYVRKVIDNISNEVREE